MSGKVEIVDAYREDLAYIHESGFAGLAAGAALALLEQLPLSHDSRGLVVDLGCGGGTFARLLQDAGCMTRIGYAPSLSQLVLKFDRTATTAEWRFPPVFTPIGRENHKGSITAAASPQTC